MRSGRGGWSIVELMIVTIVIAVLASFAIPMYINAVERSQGSQAASHLRTIREAQISFFTEEQQYSNDLGELGLLVGARLDNLDNDHWSYLITNVGADTFTLEANRLRGPNSGTTLTLNALDEWGGDYPR